VKKKIIHLLNNYCNVSNIQTDNYRKTGCYNIRCPGFVQIHKNMYPGARLKNVSSYGGPVFGFDSSITQVMFLLYIFM